MTYLVINDICAELCLDRILLNMRSFDFVVESLSFSEDQVNKTLNCFTALYVT